MTDSLQHLSQRQHEFAQQRGWIMVNSPKNLACAYDGGSGRAAGAFSVDDRS